VGFAFDRLEPVPNAVRRLVVEQLDVATGELSGAAGDDAAREKAVHEARKALKRCRAVVRLVRPVLGDDLARAENAAYRDAGQALSAARDADVLLKTWDRVVGDGVDGVDEATVVAGRQRLEDRRARIRAGAGADHGAVVDVLREARRRAAGWPDVDDSWRSLAPGLRRIHGQARSAMAATAAAAAADVDGQADDGPADDEAWHEWRKRVKDTWYHLTLLVPAWEPVLGSEEAEAHRLSELLGDDHDLAVLRAEVASWDERWSADRTAAVLAAVDDRRRPLQAEAAERGTRLYAEKPKAFAARLGAYWDAWRSGSS
jgi:CHAD domain-containing protein